MKRRILIAVVVSVLVITMAVILCRLTSKATPVYQGKTAQQWLGEIVAGNQLAAVKAFREMGSNALPVIVRAFEKEDSAWERFYQRNYSKLPSSLRNRLARPMLDRQRWVAAETAAVNVSYAQAAIPDFTRLLSAGNNTRQLYVLIALINFIGPKDTNCIPSLIGCLRSTNNGVCPLAATGLGRIGPTAKQAVPSLMAVLGEQTADWAVSESAFQLRMTAARALYRIDRQTNTMVRVFKEALSTNDKRKRAAALNYIREIQFYDIALLAPITELLRDDQTDGQFIAAGMIGAFGPAAKVAVPELIKLADSSDHELRQAALWSLKKIDPTAAAKYEP